MYNTGGYSFVVALDVETGALKLLLDDAGVPLHDATLCTQFFFLPSFTSQAPTQVHREWGRCCTQFTCFTSAKVQILTP